MSNKCFSLRCILLSALCISSVINADYPSNGVNLEFCRTSEECAGSRVCYYFPPGDSWLETCIPTAENCFCRYRIRPECATSTDCPDGERCFFFNSSISADAGKFCFSCRTQVSETETYVDDDPPTCKDVWLGGYTGDICFYNYFNCAGDRKCVQFQDDGTFDRCPLATKPCFCWPQTLTACSSSADCEDQERCATSKDGVTACFSCGRVEADDTFTQVDSDAVCSSPSPINSPDSQFSSSPSPQAAQTVSRDTPSPGRESPTYTPPPFPGSPSVAPPCISVVHLSKFKKKDLVFDQCTRAGVLCDSRDSCATPGHMAVFRNRAMTMASYCSGYATCSRRIACVNNPRMRQALRVASHTEGLYFTALSARYETKIEEYFLKLVISSGI